MSSEVIPLAYKHPENLISEQNADTWLKDLERFAKVFPEVPAMKEFVSERVLDTERLRKLYQEDLHFLSRTDAVAGAQIFAREITSSFDPQTSLFYFPQESVSARFFYKNLTVLNPEIAGYGYVRDSREGLIPGQRNQYGQKNIDDADAYIYVDDWILSAQQISSFLTKNVVRRFHTFHLVVSEVGQLFLDAASQYLFPRFIYTLPSERGIFPSLPIYGFHKIPDTLPDYYTTSQYPDYSIFGKNRSGDYISKNTRLADHTAIFV